MSKAVVFDSYGGPEVLHLAEVDPGEPDPGQVRVRVKAAGVQPFDCLFRRGDAHQWVPARFPQRLGNDFAGVVEAVGEGVTGFADGDEVVGWAMLASYSEHVVVGAGEIVAKPAGMPWAEAGVLSASGQTASTALDELRVGAGDTVLIHAAAGGVGSFAVQLAVAAGATVIGTAGERNHDYLRSLGATPVRYGEGLVERVRAAAPGGPDTALDAALDAAGTLEALESSIALVTDRARIGTTAFQPAAERLGVRRISTDRSTERLSRLAASYADGKLRVIIQRDYAMADAAAAHTEMEGGHVRGKLVLTI